MKKILLGLMLFITPLMVQAAQSNSVTEAHTTVQVVSMADQVAPGDTVWIGVDFQMESDWHVYWKNPGDSGLPPKVTWDTDALDIGEWHWPNYKVHEDSGISTNVYYERVTLWSKATISETVEPGDVIELNAKITWLACKEICIPGKGQFSLTLPVETVTVINKEMQALFFESQANWPEEYALDKSAMMSIEAGGADLSIILAIVFAFIGGLILNLMPCVLPVLSIKVLGLVKHAGDKQAAWKNGVAFTIGVLVSFWILAGVLIALRLAGQQIGWGFQFQSPLFLVFLSTVLFVFAMNLFGLFEIGTSLAAVEGTVKKTEGLSASFMSGVLATIVATPCTAPFMGSALGFAIAQPIYVSFLVFTALGLGMSFPYLILAKFPSLLKFVPKPGTWMIVFKKSLGFILLITVTWLLWVLGLQLGVNAVSFMMIIFTVVGLGLWMLGMASHPLTPNHVLKVVSILIISAALVFGFRYISKLPTAQSSQSIEHSQWLDYSPGLVDQLIAEGKPVFINFTAAWCLTCQVNKKVVLHTAPIEQAFEDSGVTLIHADWTNYDDRITQALEKFGRNSVPLYILYDRQGNVHVLPELLTNEIVLNYLERL